MGSRASVQMPNGTTTAYQYDGLNRLTNVLNKVTSGRPVLSQYGYTLHATGQRIAAKKITRQDDTSYTTTNLTWNYDSMYRLTNEVSTAGTTTNLNLSYSYDVVGNRLCKTGTENGVTETITSKYNGNDQLTPILMTPTPVDKGTNSVTYILKPEEGSSL